MQARELKRYLYEDTDRILDTLEYFGFHDAWINSDEIRCAKPEGSNRTAVTVRMVPELYASDFSSNYNGDILGLIEHELDKSFKYVVREIHELFRLPFKSNSKSVDLLKDVRKYKYGSSKNDIENKKFDPSILNDYINLPHKNLIEEGISPLVMKQFNISFDVEKSRIIFPYYDWEETDKIVGIQGRTTMDSDLAEELNIPRYWNYIKGFNKSNSLYNWCYAKENIKDSKMLIIFEGEKSTLKHFTHEIGKGYSVSVGGHSVSDKQAEFIIRNTDSDCEIVIAFDEDVMRDHIQIEKDNFETGKDTKSELIEACDKFTKFRNTSYIMDKYGLLGEKDSPIDCGINKWRYLLKHRTEANE